MKISADLYYSRLMPSIWVQWLLFFSFFRVIIWNTAHQPQIFFHFWLEWKLKQWKLKQVLRSEHWSVTSPPPLFNDRLTDRQTNRPTIHPAIRRTLGFIWNYTSSNVKFVVFENNDFSFDLKNCNIKKYL